jgi:hypothetical protein
MTEQMDKWVKYGGILFLVSCVNVIAGCAMQSIPIMVFGIIGVLIGLLPMLIDSETR